MTPLIFYTTVNSPDIGHVGDGHRRHARLGHALDQRFHADGIVHHGEFGVESEVYKAWLHGG